MKSLAVAIALTTAFALPAYAGTVHARHIATSVVRTHRVTGVIPSGRIYLLENRGPQRETGSQLPGQFRRRLLR